MDQIRQTPGSMRILLAIALVIHLASAVGVYLLRPESISTIPDPLDYRLAALNLLHHQSFTLVDPALNAPELLRTPAYPAVVALGYVFDGETGLAVVLLQSVLLVFGGLLLFHILRSFGVRDRLALISVGLYLVEPLQWMYTLHTMTETLTSTLVMALLATVFVGSGVTTKQRAALFGIGLGLLVFVKPSALMWAPFLLALLFIRSGDVKKNIQKAFVAVLCMIAVLSPWVMRNYQLTGVPILSSSGPFNLIYFAGTEQTTPSRYNDVLATVTFNDREKQLWYAYTADAYPMLKEGERAILNEVPTSELVIRQIECAPRVWFGFTQPQNQESYGHQYDVIASWLLGTDSSRDRIIQITDTTVWTVLLLLVLVGLGVLLARRDMRSSGVIFAGMLGVTIFINFCASWARVLIPMYPVVLIFAAVGAQTILTKTRYH